MALAHSYSSVKQFENCPRQYNEIRILKKFKQSDTDATLYGTAVHKAFENYIKDRTPLPAQFAQFQRFVEPLAGIAGDIRCEEKMGIRDDFTPCGFFDSDVWFRGIPDFMVINREKRVARVADYKTGKSSRFADKAQLELMAAMIMSHYPEIDTVKGVLLFVVAGDIISAEYTRDHLSDIYSRWAGRANAIEKALELGVWNPRSGPLCKFCPVTTCDHYR
jgi:RecB family exonuclease